MDPLIIYPAETHKDRSIAESSAIEFEDYNNVCQMPMREPESSCIADELYTLDRNYIQLEKLGEGTYATVYKV